MKRLLIVVAFLGVVLGLASEHAMAADRLPYSAAAFARAEAENKPILIHVTASWCPTCHVQNRVIERELFKPEFASFVIFDVDFDDQKDVVREFGATAQSTLVLFKGKAEVARGVGITDQGSIEAMMERAVE